MTTPHAHLVPSAPRLAARDLVLLAARLLVAVVLLAHGLPKLSDGVGPTADGFADRGIPFSEAAAIFAIVAEVGGAAFLALGLFTPVVGLVVTAQMAGAFWYAHRQLEPLVNEDGWELVAMIGTVALLLAVVGAGRLSADQLLVGRRRRRKAEEKLARHDAEVAADARASHRATAADETGSPAADHSTPDRRVVDRAEADRTVADDPRHQA